MRIHFIQQDPWVEPGEYLSWAERNGHTVSFTRCWLGEQMPEEAEADVLVVLGGWQSPSTTKEECGYFDSLAEQGLIIKYVNAGRAVIGVCLGAQLLGDALGAPYEHSPEREVGPVKACLTEEGRRDPLFKCFPDVFDAGAWHNDMPGLTPGAVVIAKSEGCPRQIVRYGKFVYGFQAHMEFTHDIVAAGLRDIGGEIKGKGPFIQTPAQLLAYDYTEMNGLLSSFLDALANSYGG